MHCTISPQKEHFCVSPNARASMSRLDSEILGGAHVYEPGATLQSRLGLPQSSVINQHSLIIHLSSAMWSELPLKGACQLPSNQLSSTRTALTHGSLLWRISAHSSYPVAVTYYRSASDGPYHRARTMVHTSARPHVSSHTRGGTRTILCHGTAVAS